MGEYAGRSEWAFQVPTSVVSLVSTGSFKAAAYLFVRRTHSTSCPTEVLPGSYSTVAVLFLKLTQTFRARLRPDRADLTASGQTPCQIMPSILKAAKALGEVAPTCTRSFDRAGDGGSHTASSTPSGVCGSWAGAIGLRATRSARRHAARRRPATLRRDMGLQFTMSMSIIPRGGILSSSG